MRPLHWEVDPETGERHLAFDVDPRLYQYGGGYIYLIGGTLAAFMTACVAGLLI